MGPTQRQDVRHVVSLLVRIALLVVVLLYLLPEIVNLLSEFFFPGDGNTVRGSAEFARRWQEVWQNFWVNTVQWLFRYYGG